MHPAEDHIAKRKKGLKQSFLFPKETFIYLDCIDVFSIYLKLRMITTRSSSGCLLSTCRIWIVFVV